MFGVREMFDSRSLDEACYFITTINNVQPFRIRVPSGYREFAVSAAALRYRDIVSRNDDRCDDPPGRVESANHSAELSSWSGERTEGMASNNPKRSNLGDDRNLSKGRIVFYC